MQLLWVKLQWLKRFPDWEVRICEAPSGPWCKAAAIMDAAADSEVDTVIVADADVWCDGIARAVTAIGPRKQWAIPHLKVRRLTMEATGSLFDDPDMDPSDLPTEQRPYNGMAGGGIVVVDRQTLLEVPFDRRFVGWGREDCAWRDAMLTLVGKPWRGDAPLFHLWHPPQPRPRAARTEAFPPNEELYARYVAARKRPDDMRALIAEAKSAPTPDITDPLEDACMYRYRNENTGQIVEHPEPKARLEKLDNWTRLGEDDGVVEVEESQDDLVSFDELQRDIAAFDNAGLLVLAQAINDEVDSRGLTPADDEDRGDHQAQVDAQAAIEAELPEEAASTIQIPNIDATDAAIELAEAEKIDLATVKGSGDEGRIVLDDIRKAIEVRDGSQA